MVPGDPGPGLPVWPSFKVWVIATRGQQGGVYHGVDEQARGEERI